MTLKSILTAGLLISLVLAMLMGFANSAVNLANDLTSLSFFRHDQFALHREHTSKSTKVNNLDKNKAPSATSFRLPKPQKEHTHRL